MSVMAETVESSLAAGLGTRADGPAAPPGPRSWAEMFPPRPKLDGAAYGFLSARGEPVGSSRENLLHLARTGSLPGLVWSPETEEMVPAWEVPFLLDQMRENVAEAARREIRTALGIGGAVLLGLLVFYGPGPFVVGLLLEPFVLVPLVVMTARRAGRARHIPAEQFASGFDALVEHQTETAQPIPVTRTVMYAVAAASASQLVPFAPSIDAGALDPAAVSAGEWWRLLTAPMLHGGVLHFWMNFGAMESLGRTMETRGARGWVPVVFLASALAGGAASLALPPDVRSVGASGGLMGMFGFLAVMAYRRRQHLPHDFLRGLMINIALIGAVGLMAYTFIDNAAHAGGLAAGVLIGVAAVPDGERVPRWTGGAGLEWAGRAAAAVVWLGAALAIVLPWLR